MGVLWYTIIYGGFYMLNKIFESKLLKEAFIMDIPKLKYQQAAELYSENEIIIKENTPSFVLPRNCD